MSLLDVDGVSVRFGGHLALSDVDVPVMEGTITGLIGPNGAGKTTLFNVISGLQPPSGGDVRFDGTSLLGLTPSKRARAGLARTFQRLELFTSLTVRENIQVAGEIRNRWSLRGRAGIDVVGETRRIIELLGLEAVADREVAEIPTGQARVVELGRALMTRPRLLLLDEPASGQDDHETEQFGVLLRRLNADGMTILLVEHDMSLVMSVCDHVHVLDFGSIIASGTTSEVQSDPQVLDAYLGAS
ncbi:MAG: ABC transporter ATP-binding protein [Acidimicrobiales bacterium]